LKPHDLYQSIVYVLDDLDGSVDTGGFGKGFHQGIVLLTILYYLEYNYILTDWVSATGLYDGLE
jgi:hypothetical protein